MPRYAYDRLSAQDLSFLLAENEHAPMHVGATAIVVVYFFDGPVLRLLGRIPFVAERSALIHHGWGPGRKLALLVIAVLVGVAVFLAYSGH